MLHKSKAQVSTALYLEAQNQRPGCSGCNIAITLLPVLRKHSKYSVRTNFIRNYRNRMVNAVITKTSDLFKIIIETFNGSIDAFGSTSTSSHVLIKNTSNESLKLQVVGRPLSAHVNQTRQKPASWNGLCWWWSIRSTGTSADGLTVCHLDCLPDPVTYLSLFRAGTFLH